MKDILDRLTLFFLKEMGLFQCINFFPLRMLYRYASNTRLQVFQNATQIVDPQLIRNVGIIAHIDAGI
jgi:hypothetical protein